MGTAYEIRINCNEQEKKVEDVLGLSSDDSSMGWSLTIEENSPQFSDALSIFFDLISNNLPKLNSVGIKTEMITFWYLYEYEQECNMEFWPEITKKIGDLGVILCISCWEK
ncbi:hypothetical protein TH53_10345 [Pedobacter lusitanus]|uniref:Uncharacterized protein n=1 Tax=Pedobacter lusitanus TaxID=1503925 RepID=A0A0D0GRY4_9SPHI|nr:hypothetical protein [Pedobacter lusitanus]KIO77241.1 hypothetical protein TH53_10345 [Pedobacter lusitanus]